MARITCPECGKISDTENIKDECPYCGSDFNPAVIENSRSSANRKIDGLNLIYLKTKTKIEVGLQATIIGREHTGAALLKSILIQDKPVISRKHCSITFDNGSFYIRDEGSLNGTFVGIAKQECKTVRRIVENDSLVHLGEESFVAQVVYTEVKPATKSEERVDEPPISTSNLYTCNECGYQANTKSAVCPQCSTFNSMKVIS